MSNCIFCKIIKGEIPSKKAFESDNFIAFHDINPSADIHILVVPKEHIRGIQDLDKERAKLLGEVYEVLNKLVDEFKLRDNAFRVVVNGGKAQLIPHLHLHLLGGKWRKFV